MGKEPWPWNLEKRLSEGIESGKAGAKLLKEEYGMRSEGLRRKGGRRKTGRCGRAWGEKGRNWRKGLPRQ